MNKVRAYTYYRVRLRGGKADGEAIDLPAELDESRALRVARGIALAQKASGYILEEVTVYKLEANA